MSYFKYKDLLFKLAWDSIGYGYDHGRPIRVELTNLPERLTINAASFVTIEKQKKLRGCIGTIDAYRSLAEDIVNNAFAAAFKDPRFSPLHKDEEGQLSVSISILSQPQAMQFSSEKALLEQIRPKTDGLIIEAAGKRGTFLPSVWEALPDKDSFLNHLKQKAGLDPDYWSKEIKVWRYSTECLK